MSEYHTDDRLDPQARPDGDQQPPVAPKKRLTALWVLGWIFIFPVPLTILIKRNKKLKPVAKVFLTIGLWIVCAFLPMIVNTVVNQSGVAPAVATDTVLSSVYSEISDIENCPVQQTDVPPLYDHFAVVRIEGDSERIVYDRPDPSAQNDADRYDVIAVAVLGYYNEYYDLYVNDVKQDSTTGIYIETARVFYYNPKTKTVFDQSRISGPDLPRQTERIVQKSFKISDPKILLRVSKDLPIRLDFFTRFGVWFTQELGFLFFIGIAAAVGFFFLIRGSWRQGLKKRREAQQNTSPNP